MGRDGGHIPRWPLANVYTGCMVGSHGFSFLADACVKGLKGMDYDAALTMMVADADAPDGAPGGRTGGQNYTALGYVPFESSDVAASLTLAYGFDDWSIARLAACLGGQEKILDRFDRRANSSYKHLWSPDRQLMCPRLAGTSDPTGSKHGNTGNNGNNGNNGTSSSLSCPSEWASHIPYPLQKRFLEGDAAQYAWFVPGDPRGLVALFPSPQAFVDKLENFMNKSTAWAAPNTIPNPYYWAGNEPGLLSPWLFSYAGRPDRTAYWTRWLAQHKYTAGPAGVPGNDDFGTMSAWLLFTYMGFYPRPGTTEYV